MNRPLPILLVVALLAGCAAQPPVTAPTLTVSTSARLEAVWDAASRLARKLPANRILVVFDLDNTLLAMQQELGADQWYDWQRELSNRDRCNPAVVSDRLAVQGALYHSGAMRLTEASVPDLLARLTNAGHPTMIVTARGSDFRLSTFRELRRNNLTFRDHSPGPRGGSGAPFTLNNSVRPVLYEDGALLLAGQHKGHMLVALLEHLQWPRPAAVVFADDKPRNVQAMREGLAAAGIGGELIHYTGEDARVAAFDPAAAAARWRELEPAITTVEAVMGTANHDIPPPAANCPP